MTQWFPKLLLDKLVHIVLNWGKWRVKQKSEIWNHRTQTEIHTSNRDPNCLLNHLIRILSDNHQVGLKTLASNQISSELARDCLEKLRTLAKPNKISLVCAPGRLGLTRLSISKQARQENALEQFIHWTRTGVGNNRMYNDHTNTPSTLEQCWKTVDT